ncbi:bile acid:sodium symporter family protein [Polaromonas sp.]|uniref:bile acid:sodium symporter family protein n=1 Tax=Polaromonas sp. TaxID=1869339 RepID=UPI00326757E3
MSGSPVVAQLLIIALALVMLGLGLTLKVEDFTRLLKYPKAVLVALVLQVIVLPVACYAIIVLLNVPPLFAVGLVLLAASPGGISANLFSHLFGGNVAMNISLTAINTFAKTGQVVPLQFGKVVEVIVIVLVPVAVGMWLRTVKPGWAARSENPTKIFSIVVLVVVAVGAVVKEWQALSGGFAAIGPAVLAFNLVSLLAGYYVARATGLDKPISTAISYEIGIHNATLAIFIALAVLNNFQLALPAAIYSFSMYVTATLFGLLVLKRQSAAPAPAQA